MVDSSVKTISRPVINCLPVDVNQLDEFACGQLDRVCDFASNFVLFTLLPSKKNLMVFDSTWRNFMHTSFLYLQHFSSPFLITVHFYQSQLDWYRHPSASENQGLSMSS